MIKSFHSKKPEIVHTYLVLHPCVGGVTVRAVHPDGDYIDGGQLLSIIDTGIVIHRSFNNGLGIPVLKDRKTPTVHLDKTGEELMTRDEWSHSLGHKCTNRYHTWLVDDQDIYNCDICGQALCRAG